MPLTETDAEKYRRLRHQDSLNKKGLLHPRPQSPQHSSELSVEDGLKMAGKCKKTKFVPKGTSFNGIIDQECDIAHEAQSDVTLECGVVFRFRDYCQKEHNWTCPDCFKSKMVGSLCKGLVSITEKEMIYFKECSHLATENTTFRCGTKVECVDHFGCNQNHTILCKDCRSLTLCDKIITLQPGKAYPALPCGQSHIIVDKEETESQSFNCGQSFTLTDLDSCTIKTHRIYCVECQAKLLTGGGGLQRSFGNLPSATSTPIRTDKKEQLDAPDTQMHAKPPDINESVLQMQRNVKRAINDGDINEKPCMNRKHEFDHLSKTVLAAPAKKFHSAVNMFMIQFKKDDFGLIPKELGDELLLEVFDSFEKMAEARGKCMEVLSETDILENPKYEEYMQTKIAMKNDCQRIHSEYFSNLRKENTFKKANFSHHQTPPHKMMQSNKFYSNESFYQNPHRPSFINHQSVVKSTDPDLNRRTDKFFKLKDELALIEKFDASQPRSYMAFRAQWTNFITKMNQSQRSELDKYYALLNVLDGKAKSFIQTKYPRDDTYATAISKLDTLFYQPANLIRDMINGLMKTNRMYDNYDSLLSGMTNLWNAWADLDHAELTNDQLKGLFFISATEKNLSEGSWKCWLDVQNSTSNEDPMACFDINSFMGAINQAMTNQQRKQNAIGYRASNNFPNNYNNKQKSTLYGSYNNVVTNKYREPIEQQQALKNGCCVFCNKPPHKYQLMCHELKKKKPYEIRKIMDDFNITCTMCLTKNHYANNCPAYRAGYLRKCGKIEHGKVCERLHSILLHTQRNTTSTKNSQATE